VKFSTPLVCAVLACAVRANAGESRIAWAEVELRGPLSELVLAHARAGTTEPRPGADRLRFTGALAEGETRTLAVPVPVRASTRASTPAFTWDVGAEEETRGRARFVRWLPETESASAALAPALRARPRPPVQTSAPEVPAAALLALAAGSLVVAALRRRAWLALAAALVSGSVAAALVRAGPRELAARTRVLEGAAGEVRWLAVTSGSERLALGADELAAAFEVAVEPPDAPLEVEFPLRAGEPVRLAAPRARIHVLSAAPAEAWSTAHNALGAFERSWLRAGGAWSVRGAWGSGAALPAAGEGTPAPGWLTAGLPQGVDVFVGEFARPAAEPASAGPRYVRLVLEP
jgi:hypothetical protein